MDDYCTYILQCSDNSFYVGITCNVIKRLHQHNGTIKGGAKYTRNKRPLILRYIEFHETRSAASKREYLLKRLTHQQKSSLCDASTCLRVNQ